MSPRLHFTRVGKGYWIMLKHSTDGDVPIEMHGAPLAHMWALSYRPQ